MRDNKSSECIFNTESMHTVAWRLTCFLIEFVIQIPPASHSIFLPFPWTDGSVICKEGGGEKNDKKIMNIDWMELSSERVYH